MIIHSAKARNNPACEDRTAKKALAGMENHALIPMRTTGTLLLTLLVMTTYLAGCLTSDESVQEVPMAGGQVQETSTVAGTVLTVHFLPVEGARVMLVKGNDVLAQTTTDNQGKYRIENVEPGDYRLQVTSVCCRESVQAVTVTSGDASVDILLEPYTEDDLQVPRVESYEWTGFLACSVAAGIAGLNACTVVDMVGEEIGHENATDDDFLIGWEIQRGLKSVVGAMDWQAPGAAVGDELFLLMEAYGRWNQHPRYVQAEGYSPIEFRVDAGYVKANMDPEFHEYDFDNVENSLGLAYRIFAGGLANVVYQQQFTVYWDLYYWEPAPPGASALPDI